MKNSKKHTTYYNGIFQVSKQKNKKIITATAINETPRRIVTHQPQQFQKLLVITTVFTPPRSIIDSKDATSRNYEGTVPKNVIRHRIVFKEFHETERKATSD